MSDTPRTDAVAFAVGRRLMSPKTVVVAVNNARKLELELAAVTAHRDALHQQIVALIAHRNALVETRNYCARILREAGHDDAAPLEAMVRRNIAYAAKMEAERDTLQAYVGQEMFTGDYRTVAEMRAALTKERDAAKANMRALTQVCDVCWTSSYWPCEESDEGAEAYKDGTGFVSCSMCRLTDGLKKCIAERDEALRKLAVARAALDAIESCAETNACGGPDDEQAIALNHIGDAAGEAIAATAPKP